nr:immunoglobulin heavy chain junction region [Mus musculus]
CALAWFAYW